jgi:hypothetical protein
MLYWMIIIMEKYLAKEKVLLINYFFKKITIILFNSILIYLCANLTAPEANCKVRTST